MFHVAHLPGHLLVAYTAYVIGTASPGPSNLAIMGTAMSEGKTRALALAGGIVSGSLAWGIAAAVGLASLMQMYSWSLVLMKILGGLYMLWLAWKAARAASSSEANATSPRQTSESLRAVFARGLAMHLTNPKAIFVWLSIIALAMPRDAQRADAFWVVAGCAMLGICVFGGYALAFSTAAARRIYRALHRWLNATLSVVFAYVGLRLLFTRASTG